MLPIRDRLPTRVFPFVNYGLIAVNIGCFVRELSAVGGGADSETLGGQGVLVPAQLVAHPLASAPTLLTHLFLHASVGHIAGNMLFLWIFGDNVEDALGHLRYLFFYLVCGVAAAFAQVALSPSSAVPMLGASGAIAGVLAAYAVLYPTSPITVINPIPILWLFWGLFIYLPAWFVIGEFFVVNLWSALQPSNAAGGVAFMAHVGGFVAGLLLVRRMQRRERLPYDRNYRFAERRGVWAQR
jgi:membrane associated rhomboid family serine protease